MQTVIMFKRLIQVATITAMLTGCGMLSPVPTPTVSHYQINVTPTSTGQQCNAKNPASAPIIQIARVQVVAPFDNRNMLYSVAKYQLDSYATHRWITPVDAMLTQAIEEKLIGSCIFANVVNADFMTTAKYRLNSQLLNLTQNITSNSSATLNFSILVQLVDNTSNQVIKSKVFVLKANVAPSPQGYVYGTNRVIGEFLDQLVSWLSPIN